MKPQGGYICRAQHLSTVHLPTLAREALKREKLPSDGTQLVMSRGRGGNVVRLAFERSPDLDDAHWYLTHHALAQLLSSGQTLAVQVYVLLPAELEEVVAYADGRRVGGERIRYRDIDLTDEEQEDDRAFEKLQARWPLGHLAQVFGLTRRELLKLYRRGDTARIAL